MVGSVQGVATIPARKRRRLETRRAYFKSALGNCITGLDFVES